MDPAMVKNLALGAVPPAVLALVYFVALWLRPEEPGARPRTDKRLVATPVVMAAAVVFTYAITFQLPGVPRTAFDWLPVVAIAAGFAGAIAALERLPQLVRWGPAVLAVVFAAWASARNVIANTWPAEQTGAYLLESLLASAVMLAAGHVLVSKRAGLAPVLVLMLFAGATSQLLVLGLFSMKVGQVAGMGASILIAAAAVAVWRPAFRLGPGGMVFIVVMALTTLGQGRLYGQGTPELARVYAALLTLSLVAAAIVSAGLGERLSARLRGAIVVGVAALPLLAGIGIAGAKWMEAEAAAEEGPYALAGECPLHANGRGVGPGEREPRPPARRNTCGNRYCGKGNPMTSVRIRRSQERGHFDHGWLDTYHTFSFGDYRDAAHMGYRDLRVINQDIVAPGQGFGMHPHRDMEIITYVLEGELEHRDSMGNGEVLRPGEVQRMTAGTGVLHSEFNHSKSQPVHLLQIWIYPERKGLEPGYEQKAFPVTPGRSIDLLASSTGEGGSVVVHQDVRLYRAVLSPGSVETLAIGAGRGVYVQVARGRLRVQGHELGPGDAAAIEDVAELELEGVENAEALIFDLA